MFKSIKTKLIVLALLLVTLGVAAMTGISSWLVKERTHTNVIESSTAILTEMRNSIDAELQQYGRGLEILTASTDVKDATATEGQAHLVDLLENVLDTYPNVSNTYVSFITKETTIRPYVDLEGFDPSGREWYRNAASDTGSVHWSMPYEDEATGNFVVTASKAIMKNGKMTGVAGMDIELQTLTEEIAASEIPYDGFAMLLDTEGNLIVHPQYAGENVAEEDYIAPMYAEERGHLDFKAEGIEKLNMFTTIPEVGWKLGIVYEKSDMQALAAGLRNVMIAAAVVTVLILAGALSLFISRMLKPVLVLRQKMDEVADGDLTARVNMDSRDEIGQLGRRFDRMLEQMNTLIGTVSNSAADVLASSQNLSAVSEETNATSEEIAGALQEITVGASNSAESAETVTERTDLLNERIRQTNDTADEMASLASEAVAFNADGRKQMGILKESFNEWNHDLQQMGEMIGTLEHKVQAINSVIDAITEISAQTNLLALNASIEAARAGEHGKGFAVVANEVRQLAEQTAHSAEQVRSTIEELQQGTHHVIEQMEGTRSTFERQSLVVENTEGAFGKISDFIDDMQVRIQNVTDDLREMNIHKDDVSDQIRSLLATTEESAAACEEVNASMDEQMNAIGSVAEAAEHLTQLSEDLSRAVERFNV